MSGRRIDDHSSWAGSTAGGRIPKENRVKEFSSAEGVGKLDMYEDTEDKIKRAQEIAKSKVKSHEQKDFYRN